MIGLCTDSNAQLPRVLIERYGIEVVPITICIDDHEYLEGIDIDADAFYARFGDGRTPGVTTSQPSPGQFALAYERLAERGAHEILSVHIGSALSGTLNSARLAAHQSPVPVRLIDTGTASFGVGCCAWAAAEAIAAGASLDQAAGVAESLAPTVGNVFIVGALDMIRRGGRAGGALGADPPDPTHIPVLSLVDGEVTVLGRTSTVDETVDAMAAYALEWRRNGVRARLNVAIGIADAEGAPFSRRLEAVLRAAETINEIVHYRVGPSVGAHTGPGTAGAFFYPV